MVDFFSFEEHPKTSFTMTDCVEFTTRNGEHYKASVLGVLEIGGSRRQLPLKFNLVKNREDVELNLALKWSFKAFGFQAPKLLFLKVRDIVDITSHLKLEPALLN